MSIALQEVPSPVARPGEVINNFSLNIATINGSGSQTSNGVLLMAGQVSGILFILGMDQFKVAATGSMTPSLLALIGLMIIGALLGTRLHESSLIRTAETPPST